MCYKLWERSLATNLFISSQSDANDKLYQRDTKREENILKEISDIDGNTQDIDKKICFVALSYVALTADHKDLY
ncbi:hypothetical protein RO3G_14702 [Rhizopus delemar RA 99-880]|uniref:Uncharacterized protein n=1 Tax=Rhizopus delemar (strain RA 99-880 / ATCC MYA-4621 / FGSC 9543 / NRRL 43880) TaxID=246409 RepID=I1CNG1_RHIO9|nr:hypothetical protein RO3G_14702 [Rhizopus delemar RA 99-880]|eukprot:EIE89991.1 hypothetical protein RO3G_14702 [Rhizopus delemar RA 99-880]